EGPASMGGQRLDCRHPGSQTTCKPKPGTLRFCNIVKSVASFCYKEIDCNRTCPMLDCSPCQEDTMKPAWVERKPNSPRESAISSRRLGLLKAVTLLLSIPAAAQQAPSVAVNPQ